MRYYIIAGERSGDLHAGNLVKSIRKRDTQAKLRGFGGEYMRAAGVELTLHYANMAFMGFTQVVLNLGRISAYIKECTADILQFKPDVVILIDYGGFNLRIAKFCKKHNIKVFYYITPKVWAWGQYRAKALKENVDRMFVILPFEKDFFKKFEWDVDYVGNPVLDAVKAHHTNPDFLSRWKLNRDREVIALLPGSRKQELQRIVPIMAQVAKKFPEFQFAVAAVSTLDKSLYEPFLGMENISYVEEQTYDLLAHARAAIVTSGTATLETALFRVPQIVVYQTSWLNYSISKWVILVKFISLVNLIAGREVVKEMIQDDANADQISAELRLMMADTERRKAILDGYDEIITILDTGSASENAAELMIGYLTKS
ncbi:lipid-A-disaccharide synthase [Chryseolinea lacunae]|uniref:Lipid-A-disaccharide synthase n=1 Tax=Chryseolinea lacunae TaxID=2801331 RepID=A0ABS1L3R6_9BACT|nr:lipid-A-disaccharide synthase [Chryseolinea lacunae]MBL0745206.1 lipid-A-disaccharide synthase [Chryseolinea lacunae]